MATATFTVIAMATFVVIATATFTVMASEARPSMNRQESRDRFVPRDDENRL